LIRSPTQLVRLVIFLLVSTNLYTSPPDSRAATFDPVTGRLLLDPNGFGISFDSLEALPNGMTYQFFDPKHVQLPAADFPAFFQSDPLGLEGGGALRFGGAIYKGYILGLDSLASRFGGKRVEFRVWQKMLGAQATIGVQWRPAGNYATTLRFRRTGRATDDGWHEFSSGPVDFLLGGEFAPSQVVFFDLDIYQKRSSYLGFESSSRTLIDAFEIIDLGAAVLPQTPCTLLSEKEVCGPEGFCQYGRCVDASLVLGHVPQDEKIRNDYLTRLKFDISTFEGGRLPRTFLDEIETLLDTLKQNSGAAAFWPTIHDAISRLRDGHAFPPQPDRWSAKYVPVCLHLGMADLLPQSPTLPLVFSAIAPGPLASTLQEGDALASIDGLPPKDWAKKAARLVYVNGDPEAATVFAAPKLVEAALRSGSTLVFARCERKPDDIGPCTAAEVQYLTFDMATLFGTPFWAGEAPPWADTRQVCDFRFRRKPDSPDATLKTFAGYVDQESIRTLLINGTPGDAQWLKDIEQFLSPAPEALLLDQRHGLGGNTAGMEALLSHLTSPENSSFEMLPFFGDLFDQAALLLARACYALTKYQSMCGGFLPVKLEGPASAKGIPVALLNSYDVSGNDFVSAAMVQRSAPTRIFSPGPTMGAFGITSSLPRHYQGVALGSIQIGDAIMATEDGDTSLGYLTGKGVAPHEVVLQKQSDALLGIDTMTLRAETWLKEQLP